jgi:hypothetical protein
MKAGDGLLYLKMYPKQTQRWMNRCGACQRLGYKPEMPEDITPGCLAQNLRSYFEPLLVNEIGLCPMCAATLGDSHERLK